MLARISRPRAVRAPDRHHQRRFPLRGGRAVARARHRGRHRARADAPRFRPGGRGRRRARDRSAIAMHWCSCWPPTTSFASPRNFHEACRRAAAAAAEGRIVTFGIEPTYPATNYGYIRPGEQAQRRIGARGRGVRGEAGRRDRGDATWPNATSGTAAISCSTPRPCWARSSASSRPWPRPPRRRSPASRAISTSCGSPPSRSPARRRSRSTMR